MDWKQGQLKEWDKQWEGRLNPRATTFCDICNRFYGEIDPFKTGKEETASAFFFDENTGRWTDCFHSGSEITEHIYQEHMNILRQAGLLNDDETN